MMIGMLLALLLCPAVTFADIDCGDGSHCPDGETCCDTPLGYICCLEGWSCVEEIKTCIPNGVIKFGTKLLELLSTSRLLSPLTSRRSQFDQATTSCAESMTICENKCCPLPNAVCCSGGQNCCPSSYRCDVDGERCVTGDGIVMPIYDMKERIRKEPVSMNFTSLKSKFSTTDGNCPDGTKCPDGDICCPTFLHRYNCCPAISICVPMVGKCIPLKNTVQGLDVSSTLFTDPKSFFSGNYVPCPNGSIFSHQMTSCGSECCPFPKAVCCSKGSFCCPSGFQCDVRGAGCMLDIEMSSSPNKTSQASMSQMEIVVCPDKSKCPDGNTCCPAEDGKYSCCPPEGFCVPILGMCLPSHVTQSRLYPAMHRPSVSSRPDESSNVAPCTKGSCSYLNTCCDFGCCAFRNAVCCNDRKNCCPSGYECGASGLCKFGWMHPSDGTHPNASLGFHPMKGRHLSVK